MTRRTIPILLCLLLPALVGTVAAVLIQETKLTASDGAAGDFFGASVSLSGDRALVGAHGNDVNGSLSGSVYVLTFDGTTWTQEAKLAPNDGAAGDFFGVRVSLLGDRALISAWGDDVNGNTNQGSAYVFAFDGTNWNQEAKLTASDGDVEDRFGSMAVSLSGDRALIPAPGNDDNGNSSGSAYVFRRNGTTWTQEAKLTASDATALDEFGWSVSL